MYSWQKARRPLLPGCERRETDQPLKILIGEAKSTTHEVVPLRSKGFLDTPADEQPPKRIVRLRVEEGIYGPIRAQVGSFITELEHLRRYLELIEGCDVHPEAA